MKAVKSRVLPQNNICSFSSVSRRILINRLIRDNQHEICVVISTTLPLALSPSVDHQNFKYFSDSFPEKAIIYWFSFSYISVYIDNQAGFTQHALTRMWSKDEIYMKCDPWEWGGSVSERICRLHLQREIEIGWK